MFGAEKNLNLPWWTSGSNKSRDKKDLTGCKESGTESFEHDPEPSNGALKKQAKIENSKGYFPVQTVDASFLEGANRIEVNLLARHCRVPRIRTGATGCTQKRR